ncbi:hypothetical protein AAF712_003651 [Marasmius tenuissimus]|uniref:Uncharacterized protein n=1 Tax=Marasmius tenuissimus TaxID=585030 RepID=A0ABR3A7K2_9AGAR
MSGERDRLVERQVSRIRPELLNLANEIERGLGEELHREKQEHERQVRELNDRIRALESHLHDTNTKLLTMTARCEDAEKKNRDMHRELEEAKMKWTGIVATGYNEAVSQHEKTKKKLEKKEGELAILKMQTRAARKLMKKATYMLKDNEAVPRLSSQSKMNFPVFSASHSSMIDTNAHINPANTHLQFEQRMDEWIEYRKSTIEVTPNQSLQFNAKWSHLKETVNRDEETETAVNTEDEHENGFEPTSPSSRDRDRPAHLSIYQNVDLVYGVEAYKRGDGFTNAQSLLNVIETLLNALYLYAAHVTAWPPATLIGFTSASLTLAKTILYWAQEYYCSYCAVGHNDVKTLILFWIIPNGLWIVIPSMITYTLGKDLAAQLNYADKAAKLAKLQKGR